MVDEKKFMVTGVQVKASYSWGKTVGDVATDMFHAIKEDGMEIVEAHFNGVKITMEESDEE